MSTHEAMINGLKLVYEKEGAGPAIVFLHGSHQSATQWGQVIPFFSSEYTCFALESRGRGRSDRAPDGDYHLFTLSSELASFVRQEVGVPAVLVGSSQGGLVAAGWAAHNPDLVRALYLEDIVPEVGTGVGIPRYLRSMLNGVWRPLEQVERNGWQVDQFAAALADALPSWHARDPEGLATSARGFFANNIDSVFARAVAEDAVYYSTSDARTIESGIRCPLHIAQADGSVGGIVTDEHLDDLRSRGVNFTTTYFPGGTHVISQSHPQEYVADLRAFLGRL